MEKRSIGLVLLICLLLAACGGSGDSDSEKVPVPPSSMFMVRNYQFCADEETDRFLLGYYGPAVSDTTIYFYIVNSKGDTLFRDHWPSARMVEGAQDPSDDDIMDAMKSMIDQGPVPGEVCGDSSKVFTYIGNRIGYCKAEQSVIEF